MKEIEYFYAGHSAFAYIGSGLLMKIAAEKNARIVHRPYDLRRALPALGPSGSASTAARSAYFFGREIERWAEARGAAIMSGIPTHHANDIGPCNCLLIAAMLAGHTIDRLAHRMLEAHWRDDADLADLGTLAQILRNVDLQPEPLLEAITDEQVQAVYAANTDAAIARNVFGSPTYFVDGDMFYGQDHLELVARALDTPFARHWPPR